MNTSTAEIETTNTVLRNTYGFLSVTLLFSAFTAWLSMALAVSQLASLGGMILAIVLLWFVLPKFAQSSVGIWLVLAITGLLGFGLGPMLTHYLSLTNGVEMVGLALAGTGGIFMALSTYVLVTKKDFSFMGGFLMIGLIVILIAMVANIFMGIALLSVVISCAVIMIMSGCILYDTSRIINGGETNYLYATIALYLDILNIFVHLLNLLGIMDTD